MAGLRQRKKAAAQKRIIDCAALMFREQGYEATRIEDIAEAAELSVTTFYNYFGSKADMLLATVVAETETVIAAVDDVIGAEHRCLQTAFAAIAKVYFTLSFQYTSREMWRMAVARTMLDPEAEFSRRYIDIDQQLSDQFCMFLAQMQKRDLLRAGVETEPFGRLLFNNVNLNFLEFMRSPELDASAVRAKVVAESAPVFALIETRNAAH
ncbi:TetR/AcrR family transcriptional regulator [Tropicimonas marinistellae]|uniref:TetR/AcrR family transcriptional regulator n=1 Tax=Tropicimonas marinistellae TaxID=1739787 RepID=UPI0008353A0E|nr:TetR/AcrR family transcriptional regulator [Tropicimonas marinistellae]